MSFIHNLHGQLARRSHDQRDGRDVSAADGRLRHDVDDGRQQIGQSLATSSERVLEDFHGNWKLLGSNEIRHQP